MTAQPITEPNVINALPSDPFDPATYLVRISAGDGEHDVLVIAENSRVAEIAASRYIEKKYDTGVWGLRGRSLPQN